MHNHFEKTYYENLDLWVPSNYLGDDISRVAQAVAWLPVDVNTVLDVGCGNGIFIDQLGNGFRAVGTDRSFAALGKVSCPVCQADIKELPFLDESFDAIVCMEVLEHLPQATFYFALDELSRIAKKYVLVSVPHRENLRLNIAKCPNCKREFHRAFHMRSFEQVDLIKLFENAQAPMNLERVEGIHRKSYPLFISLYLWLKTRGRPNRFRASTICPYCGFTNAVPEQKVKKNGIELALQGQIKQFVSRIWPRTHRYRWWMALYHIV